MRRLLEEELIGRIRAADAALTCERASALLRRWLLAALEDDTGACSTETPAGADGIGGTEAPANGRSIGCEVNGAILDARSPRDLLLADDRCSAAEHIMYSIACCESGLHIHCASVMVC